MAYSTDSITTIADCDVLLSMATQEKNNLLHRKSNLAFQQVNYASTSVQVEAELLSVNTELSTLDTIIATLPEGRAKDDYVEKQSKFQWRKKALTNKKADYGVIALLEKELDLARSDKEIAEVDDFFAAITARKAAL